MTMPALILAMLLATAVAALYHLLFGNSLRQIGLFWAASIVGFAIAQPLGSAMPPAVPHLGQVRVVEGTILAAILMTVVRYLHR